MDDSLRPDLLSREQPAERLTTVDTMTPSQSTDVAAAADSAFPQISHPANSLETLTPSSVDSAAPTPPYDNAPPLLTVPPQLAAQPDFRFQETLAAPPHDPDATLFHRAHPGGGADTEATMPADFGTVGAAGTIVGTEQRQRRAAEAKAMLEGRPYIPGFEVLGELGRGGMGVVYRAKQLTANRLVALKVIRNDVLENLPEDTRASTLERFRQEAQAAAQLEHDNLVTVYEVGEARGQRYYAMRYVPGKSLIDLLRNGPLDNRRAAGYLEPVARGLHYAHTRGILHRDLKPHNILIDAANDRPLLTDFGLAKFLEKGNDLTHAGEVMGTPSYMSPEQARDAGQVNALADVYSLGATLYHTLAARPPFQAANIAETIRQILYQEPVAPRQLNPAVDRDLETICLKCLQKEPQRRYESAEALADDLARYLRGEPIVARPIGLAERLWRWCRRNPVVAGLIATAALFAGVSLLAIVIGYRNTVAALNTSEQRLEMALGVVDELFTRVSEDELLNEPGMQGLRKDLLTRALKHYQFFLAESGGNEAIRDELAAARFRVGMITELTGSRDAAIGQMEEARKLQGELLDEDPDNTARLKALGDTENALGSVYAQGEDFLAAAAAYRRAEGIRTRLAELQVPALEPQRLLANTQMNLARVEMRRMERKIARDLLNQAQTKRQAILTAAPQELKPRRDLAMGYYNLGQLEIDEGDAATAITQFQSAIREFELYLERDSRSLGVRYYLSTCHRLVGGLLADQVNPEALTQFKAAEARMESLEVGNPDIALYKTELAALKINLGRLYDEKVGVENKRASLTAWLQARKLLEKLLKSDPESLGHRIELAKTMTAAGNLQILLGDKVPAHNTLAAAQKLLAKLLGEVTEDEKLLEELRLYQAEVTADLMKLSPLDDAKSPAEAK